MYALKKWVGHTYTWQRHRKGRPTSFLRGILGIFTQLRSFKSGYANKCRLAL